VNPDVTLGVYDHGQRLEVPKLGDVVYVARTSSLELNNLERGRSTSVVYTQGVTDLCVCRRDCEVARDDEIRSRDVSEIMKT